jgi:uncharacterized membrane protein YphA (DoxX/SURF4 family)
MLLCSGQHFLLLLINYHRDMALSRTKILNLWFYRVSRVLLGSAFIYSGAIKLVDVKRFARMISQYDLVPDMMLAPVAIILPIVELLAGIGLVFEVAGALSMVTGMLLMFVFVLWYGMLKDLDVDCGCFSTEELRGQQGLQKAFYRDLVMLAVCAYLYIFRFMRNRDGQSNSFWSKIAKII